MNCSKMKLSKEDMPERNPAPKLLFSLCMTFVEKQTKTHMLERAPSPH